MFSVNNLVTSNIHSDVITMKKDHPISLIFLCSVTDKYLLKSPKNFIAELK